MAQPDPWERYYASVLYGLRMVSGQAPYRLVMQDDGNLVIYDGQDVPLWSSGTCGKVRESTPTTNNNQRMNILIIKL